MEGLAYDGTDQAIGHGSDIEDDGLQFVVVDFAVRQDRFVSLLGYDFAHKDACIIIIAGTFTFQSDRKFFDNWGIDVMALVDMAAGLFDFVHLIARFYAKVIGNVDGILGGKGDSKSLGVLDVVRRLVFGQKERDFAVIRLRSPGSMALGTPFSSYVPMINTPSGAMHAFFPSNSTLMENPFLS